MSGSSGGHGREYLIEFIDMGHAVRVAAIDAETGEEVVIQAPQSASRAEMERVVIAKLERKLARLAGKTGSADGEKQPGETKRPGTGPGRGIKV